MAHKPITDQQLKVYMTDLKKHSQRTAAARAGFSERTARRFNLDPTPPSQRKIHHGRTVADPLEGFWENDLLPLLEKDSALQAVTLLRHLQSEHPVVFPDDRIPRTLERRVRQWRALNGPERDIIFRQAPEPGYMAQSDFTNADELQITIAGQSFPHLLYHFVMVYSRWEHVGVVLGGESFTALAENLQQALWSLGGVPQNHRTDSLSAAFRNLTVDQREDMTQRYEAFVGHYGMDASRNNRGEAHENGSVESQNRHLKTAVDQALILRGSRNFACIEDYRRFIDMLIARRNKQRAGAIQVEQSQLKPLPQRRTTDFTEIVVPVTRTGGFLVKSIFYSAPSQLIGQRLRVHLYDDRLEAFLGSTLVVTHPRARRRGDGHRVHVINYHHVIHALRRKPKALWSSIYRDSLFPRTEYVEAWKILQRELPRRDACRRMLKARILLKADVSTEGSGWDDAQIAEALETSLSTVYRTRRQLVEEGLEAALARKTQSTPPPRIFDGEKEAQLIALACSEPPKGYARWSLRLLEKRVVELGIVDQASDSTIGRTLKKTLSNRTRAAIG